MVLPAEDAAVLVVRTEAMADSLMPRDEAELAMTRRAAMLATRLDRCAEIEHEKLAKAVATAVADHDARLIAEVKSLVNDLPDHPDEVVRKLSLTGQGADWLVEQWSQLRDSLERNGDLATSDINLAEHLQGRRLDRSSVSSSKALALAIRGEFSHLGLVRADPSKSEAIKDRARLELAKFLESQIDRLEAHRLTLDHIAADLDRLEAPSRAVVDLSTAGQLHRRYETAAARELYKIFDYFDARMVAIDPEKPSLKPDEPETSDELASFRDLGVTAIAPVSDPALTRLEPEAWAASIARGPSTEPLAHGRSFTGGDESASSHPGPGLGKGGDDG